MVMGRFERSLGAEIIAVGPTVRIDVRVVRVYDMRDQDFRDLLRAALDTTVTPAKGGGFPWWLLPAVLVVYEVSG